MRTLTWKYRVVACFSAFAVAAVVLVTAPATVAATSTNNVEAIDNTNRRQVATTYRNAIAANLALSSQWSGSTDGCAAGASSTNFDDATVEAINWFRRMSGLANVVEDPSQSANAQLAALMMQAQNQLSHSPASSWNCYSVGGAKAASTSNLTLGVSGVGGVLGQIEDPGAANVALGHRRWLLFPELEMVGVGNTSRAGSVQVINNFGARATETPWVQWPPAGFVPDDVVFDRWSISYAGQRSIDLSGATVRVTENGRPLPVTQLPVIDGFGDPALGFELPTANPTAAGDTVYRVEITGLQIDGRPHHRSYTVTAFDADASLHICQGQTATMVGTSGADTIEGTSGPDVIVGLGGNDRIEGRGGNDIICAGAGNDVVLGGWGADQLFGGNGQDTLEGSRGNDVLNGGNGRDRLWGQQDGDLLIGGAHDDTLTGGIGIDVCWGGYVNRTSASGDTRSCERGR